MVIETTNSLVEAIRELNLLDADRLDLLANDLAGRFPQVRDLGRHLMQLEWLTAFQVNQLLQGRGRQLILGSYVMLRRLGSGGMGEVFEARHRKLQRVAALKVVSRERFSSPLAQQRFLREAAAAAQLSHHNVVAVHDAGQQDDNYYLAMEFVDGVDLARLLQEAGPLPLELACDFIRQAAQGLHHAHEKGLVHRDVKPQNLLAAPRGGLGKDRSVRPIERFVGSTVKVLDLGLVRLGAESTETSEKALTQQGIVLGTMDYLSPEQARNSHSVDRRADLYSLGCTLYHLLGGRVPFPGGQVIEKLFRHQSEDPARLCELRQDVPASLEAVVTRLMAKRPDDRYATAADAAMALLPFCSASLTVPLARGPSSAEIETSDLAQTRVLDLGTGDEAAIPTAPDLTMTPPAEAPAPQRRPAIAFRKSWPWLAGTAAALALVLLILLLSRKKEQPNDPQPEGRDCLAEFVPPDSVGVLSVRPRELSGAAVFGGVGGQVMLDEGLRELLALMDADVKSDVEQVRTFLPARRDDEATVVMRGRFDPAKFLRGSQGLQEDQTARGELFRHRQSGTQLMAQAGYAVLSKKLLRIESALEQTNAIDPPPPPRDADLRRMLAEVDRKQSAWLALVPPQMDGTVVLSKEAGVQETFRFIVDRARTIQGGLSCGENLTLRLVIEARSEKEVGELQKHLADSRFKGRLQSVKAASSQKQRLWARLLAHLDWTRQGERLEVASVVKGAWL